MGFTKKINTIIVDNCKPFCTILNDYLLNQNDIVITGIANDGIEALKLIQKKSPELILLNIIMPNLDGLEVLEKLRTMKINPMPFIIILSAVSESKIINRAMALGADCYIVKPFELDYLIKTIRQMFDNNTNTYGAIPTTIN